MHTITRDLADQTWDRLMNIEDDDTLEMLIDRMGDAQPAAMAYLMSMGEGDFNEDEQEFFLILGMWIWQTLVASGSELAELNDDHFEAVREENVPWLEEMAEESSVGWVAIARKIVAAHPQSALLQATVELIEEEDEDVIREQNRGVLLIFLKILTEALSLQ